MTVIVGVLGAAVLFGLFTVIRPRDDKGCTGQCAGCGGHGGCDAKRGEHD